MTGPRDDVGSASVLVVASIVAMLAAGGVAGAVAGAVDARNHAAVAADAGALAAATHAVDGPAVACALAARVVAADGAGLRQCAVRGSEATVGVTVAVRLVLGWRDDVRLNARAGPAETNREKPAPPVRPS